MREASADSPEAPAGGTVRLRARVANAGRAASRATKAAFALEDPHRGKIPLGEADVPALAPGEERSVTLEATIPETAAAQAWALLVVADPAGAVEESDEGDNAMVVTGALSVTAKAPPRPDLVARRVEVEGPAAADPAGAVAARVRVANEGGAPAPAFDVTLCLATRERPEPRREGWAGLVSELGRATVPAGLAPGAETLRRIAGRLPPGLPPGAYFLVAIADPEGAAGTGPRRIVAAPFMVRGRALLRLPDSGVALDREETGAGEAFTVVATVRNDGYAASSAASVAIVFARDPGPAFRRRLGAPAEEWELATLPLEALRPRESRQLIASVKAPPGLPRGRFRVVLRLVRPGEEPQDLGETTIALRATAAGIDLVAYEARVSPEAARAGEGVRMTVRVGNVGDGPSPATRAALVLSDSAEQRIQVLGVADVPALAPRQDVDVTLRGRLPRDLPEGRAWLGAAIDSDSRIPEPDRENNTAWASVEVLGRYDRDVRLRLGPLSADAGPAAAPGGPVDVFARVENASAGAVDEAEVEVVLLSAKGVARSLGRRALGAGIAAGEALDLAERFLLPADLEPGRYTVRLVVDPDRRLPWAEPAGPNWADAPLDVGREVDRSALAVAQLEADEKPGSGGRRFLVSAMLRNLGPAAAPEFGVEASLAAGDLARPTLWLPLSARTMAAGLAAGVETRARFEVEVPPELPAGAYRLVVTAGQRRATGARELAGAVGSREIRVGEEAALPPAAPAAPVPAGTAPAARAPGLPLVVAAFLPGEGLAGYAEAPVRFLFAYPADWTGAAVVRALLVDAQGHLVASGDFPVPPSEAGVAATSEGRLRVPGRLKAETYSLRLQVGAAGSALDLGRADLTVSLAVR